MSKLALWGDETTGGNQLRPDSVGKYLSIYFCFVDLPEWFRSAEHGWFPIGVLPYSTLQNARGKYGGVLKAVFRMFFLGRRSFSSGFRVADGWGNAHVVQSKLLCMIQDEKAHKEAKARG
eukprot:5030365-Pyramimonas_sp.AAC.2